MQTHLHELNFSITIDFCEAHAVVQAIESVNVL